MIYLKLIPEHGVGSLGAWWWQGEWNELCKTFNILKHFAVNTTGTITHTCKVVIWLWRKFLWSQEIEHNWHPRSPHPKPPLPGPSITLPPDVTSLLASMEIIFLLLLLYYLDASLKMEVGFCLVLNFIRKNRTLCIVLRFSFFTW